MRILFALCLALPALAATNRTVTVKPSGGDYTSLAAAVAGEEKNLVSLDRQLTIECYAKQDTTAVVFERTAWTTDATRYILVTAPAGERHAGVYDTSKYRLEVSGNWPLRIHHGVFITVEYLQIYLTGNPSSNWRVLYPGAPTNSASNITIRNNIIRTGGDFNNQGVIHSSNTGNASTNVYIYNNLIYGGAGTNAYGFQTDIAGNYYLWNNTVGSGANGMRRNAAGVVIAVNNLLNVSTAAATGTFAAGTNSNATNRSSMGYTVTGGGNTSDRVSQTFTFVDAGAADYHLSEADAGARNAGIADPGSGAFGRDIDGEPRYGLWDIGADEYPSAGRRRNIVIASRGNIAAGGGQTGQKEWK
jgi:hypothetical protein